ncbi:Bud-site selection protein [Glonium stellatum]|uniref:Bud-site selection protein n=1 Tax=Glonium stellatum TaxID=574774 RepID=A0A8E2EVJ7_9PEZI|nr:Bud-site selection protein [Glonium stellatum]
MPKRKLSELFGHDVDDQDGFLGPASTRQATLCEERIEHGKKPLHRALKLAAGFERQKYSRRRKTAKQSNDTTTLARLDAEYKALKSLDITAVAENHLYKTLLKIKAIATSPSFPPSVAQSAKPTTDHISLNVTARLYKSNPVRKVLLDVISDIRIILGVDDQGLRKAETTDSDKGQGLHLKVHTFEESKATRQSPTNTLYTKWSSVQDAMTGLSDHDGGNFAEYNARLASSSECDSEDDTSEIKTAGSDSIDGIARRRNNSNPLRVLSLSPEPQKFHSLETPDRAKTAERSSSIPSKSTFLPSLTMGGYWSGSESAPEDDIEIAPKKNRRGQRARQQLWEKKYGASARHLQSQKINDRNKGWDPQKGAQLEDSKYRKRTSKQGNISTSRNPTQKSVASDANRVEVNPRRSKPRDDTGSLHPSWQAAKIAKEKKQSATFQGKKTVFD